MRERLLCIIRKEFRQAFREPRMRGMLFLPPLIQLFVFGFAMAYAWFKVSNLITPIRVSAQTEIRTENTLGRH